LETFKALDPVAYLSKFTSSNTRPSSRPHHTSRKTTVLPSILTRNTHGSSLTTMGNTKIITGITLQVGTPSPSQPKSGEISIDISFSPLCGNQYNVGGRVNFSEYNVGNKSSAAISYSDPQSLESYIRRVVLSSEMVELDQLCIAEGKAAWKIVVSCMVINHDGNAVDGILLGIDVALKDLKLPPVKVEIVDKNPVVRFLQEGDIEEDADGSSFGKTLTFQKLMVPLTVGFFQGKMLVDPSLEEELLCEGMMTVVVDAMSLHHDENQSGDGNGMLTGDILDLTKSGGNLAAIEDIAACVQLAFGRAKELQSILL